MDEGKNSGNEQSLLSLLGAGPYSHGLTKREYFAAMAMQGFCSNTEVGNMESKRIAEFAVDQADALLAELAKTEAGG